jgi:hypothetical protein
LKTENEKKYKRLKNIENKLVNAQSADDYNSIIKELKIKTEYNTKQEDEIKVNSGTI